MALPFRSIHPQDKDLYTSYIMHNESLMARKDHCPQHREKLL